MKKRISKNMDGFHVVNDLTDQEIAQLSRKIGIDIAVDLKGHTQGARTGIFFEKCAPIQVNYLGYPGTIGSNLIDFVITDSVITPHMNQPDLVEKVVLMPHCYQANDSTRTISNKIFTKSELGLPEVGFIFCCFNNNYKILPNVFMAWMKILEEVPNSVLWLYEENPFAADNLKKNAEARGINKNRLIFAKHMPMMEHLARIKLADLFLDTYPCNAHTTASDSLWAGVPLLTIAGDSFASRVASSLLVNIELDELISGSIEDYINKAIYLGKNQKQLNFIKNKLSLNKNSSKLFNGKLFARHLELAFTEMHRQYINNLAPQAIDVQTLAESFH